MNPDGHASAHWPVNRAAGGVATLLFWALLTGCSLLRGGAPAEPFPGTVPGTEIGSALLANSEPSGAAWHPVLNQLFICSDNNSIARMNANGTSTTNWSITGNWEGIAVAVPSSNFVYVADENTGHIREFNFASGTGARDFNLTTAAPGPSIPALTAADIDALVDGGDTTGVEALTFVPDVSDPEGGLFWVGSQENGTIYKFRLSISSGTTVTYFGSFKTWPAGDNDLAGLEYDWIAGSVLAVWDAPNMIRALTPAGVIFHEWPVPAGSNDEEGIAFNGTALFLAEDPAPASEVWRYDNFTYSSAGVEDWVMM